jgi:hypothetical protein
MAKKNLRAVPVTSTVLGCIEGGYSYLAELQSECQEIVDNASEGLSETQRIQTLSETADALSSADSQPDVPEFLQDIEVTYTEDRRKSKSHSRATRCGEACCYLSTAIEGIGEWIDEQPAGEELTDEISGQVEEAEVLRDELQELLDAAEGCEFPGMYG